MSYIGNQPATAFETVQKQISTSNSGTTITLDRAVTSVQDILVTIDAVVQSYDNYSVSGTTLTVGGTLSNNRVEILYVGRTMQSVDPTDDSVSAAKIKTDAVTTAKVQNDAITVDKLNLVSTSSVPSLEAKGDGGSQDGYIQLNCSQNSHGIKIKSAPHSANASYTLTLPNNDGDANQFLQTDGNGVLSFANAGGTFVPLSTISSTSNTTTHTFSNVFSSTYSNYFILCHHCQLATDNEKMICRMRSSSGQFTTTSYQVAATGFKNGSSAAAVNFSLHNSSGWDITTNIDNTNSDVGRATFYMYVTTPNSTTFVTDIIGQASYRKESQDRSVANFSGTLNSKTAFTGIDFFTSSGDIAQFNATCYGIKTS